MAPDSITGGLAVDPLVPTGSGAAVGIVCVAVGSCEPAIDAAAIRTRRNAGSLGSYRLGGGIFGRDAGGDPAAGAGTGDWPLAGPAAKAHAISVSSHAGPRLLARSVILIVQGPPVPKSLADTQGLPDCPPIAPYLPYDLLISFRPHVRPPRLISNKQFLRFPNQLRRKSL